MTKSIPFLTSMIGAFQFSFNIGYNQLTINETNDVYEMRINNQVFNHLYNLEKTKKEFEFEGQPNQKQEQKYDPKYESKFENKYEIDPNLVSKKPTEKRKKEEEHDIEEGFDHGFDKFAPSNT